MSSNLTISYASPVAASPAPAGVAMDGSAAHGPLGFLAALLDQLLAGAGDGAAPAPTQQSGDAGIPGLLDLALATPAGDQPAVAAGLPDLLADLNHQLGTLADQLAAGQAPDDGQLDDLRQTVEALATSLKHGDGAGDAIPPLLDDLIARLSDLSEALTATAPVLAQQLAGLSTGLADLQATAKAATADDRAIGAILRVLLGTATAERAPDDDSAPMTDDDRARQMFASLGIDFAPAPPAAAAETTAAVPPDLLRLSDQLTKLGAALSPTLPELARKLEAVAIALVATDADPDLLPALRTAASSTDSAALQRLVHDLTSGKVAAPAPLPAVPQIAATAGLDLPDPLLSPAPPVASAPRDAPRIVMTEIAAAPAEADVPPPAEPKAAAGADIAKAEGTTPIQQAGVPPGTQAPAGPRLLPAVYQPAANPINMTQMAFELARQVHQGTSRFTIRLDPPELGRVDVKLHVDGTGAVSARLTVDRAETLDLFQRDQRSLERALAQAGLDSSRTSLEFSLRQNFDNAPGGGQQRHPEFAIPAGPSAKADDTPSAVPAITLHRGTASAGGVNIFV